MYILLFLLILFIIWNQSENFISLKYNAERLYGMAKHVRLNKFGRVESIHLKPPLPKAGESKCIVVDCPSWVPDNITCYICF